MRAYLILPPVALLLGACATTSTRANFRRADVNHDRKLDKPEFTDGIAGIIMEKFDADKDGAVTLQEWRAVEGTKDDKGFKQRDSNRDGKITLPEARKLAAKGPRFGRLFDELDANQDQAIEWSEVEAYKKAHPEPTQATATETTPKN